MQQTENLNIEAFELLPTPEEIQTHREMSSGLSTSVGFKNGTDGSVETAINAILSAASPHRFLGLNNQGRSAVVHARGNGYGDLVLRGGGGGVPTTTR